MNVDDLMELIEDLDSDSESDIEDELELLDTIELLYDIQEFYNRFYVYISQVFGDLNFRADLLKLFNLPKGAVFYEPNYSDARGGTWGHHLAVNLKTKKKICSTSDLGQQDVYTEDTACQIYSIYNTLIINRDRILNDKKVSQYVKEFVKNLKDIENVIKIKRYTDKKKKLFNPERIKAIRKNTKKMVKLLLWLVEEPSIKKIIDTQYFWARNPDKPESVKLSNYYINEGSGLHVVDMSEKLM